MGEKNGSIFVAIVLKTRSKKKIHIIPLIIIGDEISGGKAEKNNDIETGQKQI